MATGKNGRWRDFIALSSSKKNSGTGHADLQPPDYSLLVLPVLLFKRILNSENAVDVPADNRKAKRYAVGPTFPFAAVLTLLAADKIHTQAWGARITELSEAGAHVHLDASAVARRGESGGFKLSVNDYVLKLAGTVTHFRNLSQYASCGFSWNFPNQDTRRAYLQLLEPVAVGASLAEVSPYKVVQDTMGLVKEEYRDESGAVLSVWRRTSGPMIYSFDFRMNRYGVRWSEGRPEVEPYGWTASALDGKKDDSPFISLTQDELDEVRWFFCLAVPNLAKTIPADVRKFLTALVT